MIESILVLMLVPFAIVGLYSAILAIWDLAVGWGLRRWAARNQMILLGWECRPDLVFRSEPPPFECRATFRDRAEGRIRCARLRCAPDPVRDSPLAGRFEVFWDDERTASGAPVTMRPATLDPFLIEGWRRRPSLAKAGLTLAVAASGAWAFAPAVIDPNFSISLITGGALAFLGDGAYLLLASLLRQLPEGRAAAFASRASDGGSMSRRMSVHRSTIPS